MTAAAKDEPAFASVTTVSEQPDYQRMQSGMTYMGKGPTIQVISTTGGLTKRELFAGMAMQGLCAAMGPDYNPSRYIHDHDGGIASDAVALADALLAELAKGAERG